MKEQKIKILITLTYIISAVMIIWGAYSFVQEQVCGGKGRLIIVAGLILGALANFLENYLDKRKIRYLEEELRKIKGEKHTETE